MQTTTITVEFMISDWQDRYHRSLYDDDAGKAAHNIVNRLGAIGLGFSYGIDGKLELEEEVVHESRAAIKRGLRPTLVVTAME